MTEKGNISKSEKELAESALLGDENSFHILMERFYDSVYINVLQIIDNTEDAEDICQETFNKAFWSLASYNSDWAFSTWLITIAKNCAIDFYRKKKTRASIGNAIREDTSELAIAAEMAHSPEEKMISKQAYDQLVYAIKKLGPKYRKAAELRFIHEYAYEEIAQELEIPLNTVRTRINRARKKLMETWKN